MAKSRVEFRCEGTVDNPHARFAVLATRPDGVEVIVARSTAPMSAAGLSDRLLSAPDWAGVRAIVDQYYRGYAGERPSFGGSDAP